MNPLRPWFRMYTHARTSKKLASLTDAEHRLWFKLLCYASEQEPAGSFRIDADTALEVDVLDADNEGDPGELARLLSPRRMARLIDDLGDGLYQMHDYAGWQKPSDSPAATRARKAKERAKRRAEKAANTEGVTEGHAPVTRDTKKGHATEVEIEVEGEGEVEEKRQETSTCPPTDSIQTEVLGYWSGKTGREPTDAEARSLRSLCRRFPAGVLCMAIGQAVVQGEPADNFALITTIAKAEVSQ